MRIGYDAICGQNWKSGVFKGVSNVLNLATFISSAIRPSTQTNLQKKC